jgi:phenylacetate-CoA ligase
MLRLGVFGAEPWSEELRRLIESKSGVKAFDCYGLSEIIGPGVAFECEARAGLHINEDLFYLEVLDPQTGEPVPSGTVGELALTSLAHEALPLLRYRTGDLTALWPGGCSCGRTLRKMDRIMGRTDDMLIVAGVNFYPSQVERLILDVPGANGQYQIWLSRDETRDRIEVRLEVEQDVFADANAVARVAERAAHLLSKHGLPAVLEALIPGSGMWRLPRFIGLGRARRMVLTGELMDAPEAQRTGLLDWVVPESELDATVARLTEQLLKGAQTAQGLSKRLVTESFHTSFAEVREMYLEYQARTLAALEHRTTMDEHLQMQAQRHQEQQP